MVRLLSSILMAETFDFNIHLEYKMKMCSFFKRVVPVLVLVSVSVSVSENFLEVLRLRILCLISVGETFTRP